MVFENTCDSLRMLYALFCNDGKVANGDPIIGYKIVQRILVVINNFIRWETGRHNGQVSLRAKPKVASERVGAEGLVLESSRTGVKELGVEQIEDEEKNLRKMVDQARSQFESAVQQKQRSRK